MKKTKYIYTLFFILIANMTLAQENKGAIEQTFHESGKINVVVAVLVVVFIGIIFFLIRTDRQISKLED